MAVACGTDHRLIVGRRRDLHALGRCGNPNLRARGTAAAGGNTTERRVHILR